jgi:hypothetical protein
MCVQFEVSQPMPLEQLLDQVTDRSSFFIFVSALIADREKEVEEEKHMPTNPYGGGVTGWENVTIERFLEAALAWAQSTNMGQTQGLPEEPSWKAFAVFLYCGKVYE